MKLDKILYNFHISVTARTLLPGVFSDESTHLPHFSEAKASQSLSLLASVMRAVGAAQPQVVIVEMIVGGLQQRSMLRRFEEALGRRSGTGCPGHGFARRREVLSPAGDFGAPVDKARYIWWIVRART